MAELIMQEESSTPSTPSSGKWKIYPKADGYYILDDAGLEIGPVGPLYDYIITPSVATNDLTVAIKNIAGANPSSSKPILFRVGNTVYALAAATSFTKNDGTNWANLGSAELAALPHDLFVYAIGETGASAGLKFGWSRIPYARTMGDFVNTTTSEKYIAGNWTNFNSTDPVTNIGRFRAQLSAGAGYTWSIPSTLVINYPTYESDYLTWTPTLVGFSANPTNTIYEYRLIGKDCRVRSRQGTNGTSNANNFTMTTPFTALTVTNGAWNVTGGAVVDNGVGAAGLGFISLVSASNVLSILRDGAATAWTTSGGKRIGYFDFAFPIG